MSSEPNAEANSVRDGSRWKRIAAVIAVVLGGFVIFLASGLGISSGGGLTTGGIVVFAAMLITGVGLAVWGVSRLRT